MKKMSSLIPFIFLYSFLAHANTVVVGGFGTDGATLQSIPSENSVELAEKIYKDLDAVPTGVKGKKIIEAEDGNFECEEPRRGISIKTAGCMFEAYGEITGDAPMTVRLGAKLSENIYHALKTQEVQRVGASTKSVGNLTCTEVYSRVRIYKCLIADVNAIQVTLPENL